MKVILVKLSQTNFFLVHKVFTNKVFYIFWIKRIQNTSFGFTLYGKKFFNRENEHWNDVNYFAERYQSILNFDEYSYKLLYDQFHEYKLANENEINLEEAIISEYNDGSKDYRMDIIWYTWNNLKSLVGYNSRFHLLFQVAKLIFITPHSNSEIKRVYSLVNKTKRQGTEHNRLDIKVSFPSILAVKLDRHESKFACYNFRPDESLLLSAKKATRLYNKAHCSKSKWHSWTLFFYF